MQSAEESKIVKEVYGMVEPISIDKGILEKADSIKMIKADFKWMDLGSIKDFFEMHPKDDNSNVLLGNSITNDVSCSYIYNNTDDLLVAIGINNLSIIKNNNVCIVCNNKNINEISKIYEKLENKEIYKKFM